MALARRYWLDPANGQWVPWVGAASEVSVRSEPGAGASRSDLAISAAWGVQLDAVVAWNGDRGEYLVAWQDGRNGSDFDIYAQRLRPNGELIGDNFAIVVGEYDQWAPWIVYRPAAASYWLVWHHRERERNLIFVQTLSATGAPKGSAVAVPSLDVGRQWLPAAGYDAASDELLVVWEDMVDSAILGQRVSGAGLLVGETVLISAEPQSQWTPPVVAQNPMLREYLVAWDDLSRHAVRGQIIERDGALRGSGQTITPNGRPLVSSAVSGGSDGGYWVFWTEESLVSLGDADILGQRLNADAQGMGDASSLCTRAGSQRDCVAYYDGIHAESVLVWWENGPIAANRGIHSQRLSWTGERLGLERLLSSAGVDAMYPRLACSPAHDSYLVVWHSWSESTGTDPQANVAGTNYTPQRYCSWLPLFAHLAPGSAW